MLLFHYSSMLLFH